MTGSPEGTLARAVHKSQPNAVGRNQVLEPGLMGLPIRLVACKVLVPRESLENTYQEARQEIAGAQTEKGPAGALCQWMKIDHGAGERVGSQPQQAEGNGKQAG